MSAAKKCDRCGKLYEEYNTKNNEKDANGIRFLNINSKYGNYVHGSRDLCPECMEELKAWFYEHETKVQ